jgi:hypothetical protein
MPEVITRTASRRIGPEGTPTGGESMTQMRHLLGVVEVDARAPLEHDAALVRRPHRYAGEAFEPRELLDPAPVGAHHVEVGIPAVRPRRLEQDP